MRNKWGSGRLSFHFAAVFNFNVFPFLPINKRFSFIYHQAKHSELSLISHYILSLNVTLPMWAEAFNFTSLFIYFLSNRAWKKNLNKRIFKFYMIVFFSFLSLMLLSLHFQIVVKAIFYFYFCSLSLSPSLKFSLPPLLRPGIFFSS